VSAAAGHRQIAAGVSNHTKLPAPMTASQIELTATAIHQGRTQRWQAGITDAGRRLIATSHVRLHNAGLRP
jgi:acyl-coenzyme A thioesterase PaaI-like protein